MANPIGRAPLDSAQLSLLQTRPTATPASSGKTDIAAPTARERAIPLNGTGPLRRGSLIDIIA
jgi:hypothetical protein